MCQAISVVGPASKGIPRNVNKRQLECLQVSGRELILKHEQIKRRTSQPLCEINMRRTHFKMHSFKTQ